MSTASSPLGLEAQYDALGEANDGDDGDDDDEEIVELPQAGVPYGSGAVDADAPEKTEDHQPDATANFLQLQKRLDRVNTLIQKKGRPGFHVAENHGHG